MEILLVQHKVLKKEMAVLKEESEKESLAFEMILNYLQNFKYELIIYILKTAYFIPGF